MPCRSLRRLQITQQQLLARWVQSLNPRCILTDNNICTVLRDGGALVTILALADSAHILARGQTAKLRSRADAINNLDVILRYIYNEKIPPFITTESLYTTVNPRDWWNVLSAAFYRRAYLPLKRRENDLMSLLHPTHTILFPFNDNSYSPTDCLVYVFLLYNYFLIPADFLSLISLRPESITKAKLNWSIIISLLNHYGIKLIFTPDELSQAHIINNSSDNKIYRYMLEYMLLSLLDTLQARMKTALPGEGELLGSLIRKLRHEYPDKEFYYCFADYFVIVHFDIDQRPTLECVPKFQKHAVLNMFSLNRCSKCAAIPCTVDYNFFIFSAKIARNLYRGSIEAIAVKWTDCSLILSPVCMLIVTLLDDIFIPLVCVTRVQANYAQQRILLIFKEAVSGLSSLLIYLEGSDFSALARRLSDIIESKN